MRGGLKATFSIRALDAATGEVGCAVQSCYFAVDPGMALDPDFAALADDPQFQELVR